MYRIFCEITQKQKGVPPSLYQLAKHLSAGKSTIKYHLGKMVNDGRLEKCRRSKYITGTVYRVSKGVWTCEE